MYKREAAEILPIDSRCWLTEPSLGSKCSLSLFFSATIFGQPTLSVGAAFIGYLTVTQTEGEGVLGVRDPPLSPCPLCANSALSERHLIRNRWL